MPWPRITVREDLSLVHGKQFSPLFTPDLVGPGHVFFVGFGLGFGVLHVCVCMCVCNRRKRKSQALTRLAPASAAVMKPQTLGCPVFSPVPGRQPTPPPSHHMTTFLSNGLDHHPRGCTGRKDNGVPERKSL